MHLTCSSYVTLKKRTIFFKFALYLKAQTHYGLKQYDPAKILLDRAVRMDRLFKEAKDLMIKILQEEHNISPSN